MDLDLKSARLTRLICSPSVINSMTIGWHVTLDEVARDPLGPNARLGRFTTFTNLADLCAITIAVKSPTDQANGNRPPISLTLHGPAWSDGALADAARRIVGDPAAPTVPHGWLRLAVVGAHLRGQPLDHQLIGRGAVYLETTTTAPVYGCTRSPARRPQNLRSSTSVPVGRRLRWTFGRYRPKHSVTSYTRSHRRCA